MTVNGNITNLKGFPKAVLGIARTAQTVNADGRVLAGEGACEIDPVVSLNRPWGPVLFPPNDSQFPAQSKASKVWQVRLRVSRADGPYTRGGIAFG